MLGIFAVELDMLAGEKKAVGLVKKTDVVGYCSVGLDVFCAHFRDAEKHLGLAGGLADLIRDVVEGRRSTPNYPVADCVAVDFHSKKLRRRHCCTDHDDGHRIPHDSCLYYYCCW